MSALRLLCSLALALAFTACSTPELRVMEAEKCPVPADQLAAQCALPQSLQPGATYDDLVTLAVQDSLNLRACAEQSSFLRKAIEACNASIEQHNERIREINAKVKASR